MDNSEFLRRIFLTFVNTDPAIREPSESYVLNRMANDTVGLIFDCAAILMKDEYEVPVYFYALDYIGKSFRPTDSLKIDVIRGAWMKCDLEKRNFVKNAVFRGLVFPDIRILNMTAYVFAKIFAVEGEEMLGFIDMLFALIRSGDYRDETHVAGVRTIIELCQFDILGSMKDSDNVKEYLFKITQFIGSMFSDPSNSEIMKVQLALALNQLVLIAEPIFNDINIFNNIVTLITEYLSRNPSPDFHGALVQIFLSLTKTFYRNMPNVFQNIGIPMCNTIMNETDPKKIMNGLEFWKELSKYEIKKIKDKIDFCNRYNSNLERFKKNKSNIPPPISFGMELNNLSSGSTEIIGKKLFYFLSSIDNDDTEPEGSSINCEQIHQKAFVCLANFYMLNPRPIFELVKQFWMSNNPITSPYPIKHAMILSIIIICSQPHEQLVYNFLTGKIYGNNNDFCIPQFLIDCLSDKIPRIIETSLFAIRTLITEYNIYMNQEIISYLINALSKLIYSHKSIVEWVISVVLSIITNCSNFSRSLILEKYFGSLMRFPEEILKPENIESDIIQNAYMLKENLILRSPTIFKDGICNILNNSIEKIQELTRSISNTEKTIVLLTSHIQIITVCFKRYSLQFEPYGIPAANAIFKVMKTQSTIYEEGLLGLMSVITSLRTFSEDFYNQFIPNINFAIQSQNPSLISKTVMLLGTFYQSVFSNRSNMNIILDLEKRLPDTISLICNCLQNSMFTRNFYPELLKGLALVIKSTPKIIAGKGSELIKIYQMFLETPLILSKEEDIKYGISLYEAVAMGYEALLYTLSESDVKNRGIRRIFMDLLPKKMLALDEFSVNELKAMCRFFESFNDVFKRDGNIILNRIDNYKLLLVAMSLKVNMEIEKEILIKDAEKTWKIMANA